MKMVTQTATQAVAQTATQAATTLDNAMLRKITNTSHTSVVTMLLLALRIRDREFSDLATTKDQLIKMGEKIVDDDYMKFWASLQAAGIGAIVHGRRGRGDRFRWHYSLRTIARAAIEGREEAVKALAAKKPVNKAIKVEKKKRGPKVQVTRPQRMVYDIPLRGGRFAEVIVSGELSKSELRKVKTALGR